MERITYYSDPNFPFDNIQKIATAIEDAGIFVHGYIPPNVGKMDLSAFFHARDIEDQKFVVLPDRNLVSRMANVLRTGIPEKLDQPTLNAIRVLAFCKAMDFLFEPSIAYHELAQHQENNGACEELRWFRAADNHPAKEWIEAALGRRNRFSSANVPEIDIIGDLSFLLKRWRRNYIACLKIGELELAELSCIERVRSLLEWMYNDFLLAGPAAIFSTFYFSPVTPRRRMMKQLRSTERDKAIKGVKNAAWDLTHLSDFVLRVSKSKLERKRYIFATSDFGLAKIAQTLLLNPHQGENQPLVEALEEWWPTKGQAQEIVNLLSDYMSRMASRDRQIHRPASTTFIDDLIAEGEEKIRGWRPDISR